MLTQTFVPAALVLALTPGAAVGQPGSNPSFAPAADISFRITLPSPTHSVATDLQIHYEIVNISNHALYVPNEWEMACPPQPHIQASLENADGEHLGPGWGSACVPWTQTLSERLERYASLLRPGDWLRGAVRLNPRQFPPGAYRVEVALYGWTPEAFRADELRELSTMDASLLRGEASSSASVTLVR